MQQIADWLEQLGMSEYAGCFAENKIDVSVLRHLSDQDLKDIGIPLGHRREMLAAIVELAAEPATLKPEARSEPDTQDDESAVRLRDVPRPSRFDWAKLRRPVPPLAR